MGPKTLAPCFTTEPLGGAAKAMGYKKLITYTEKTESGASLLASNWALIIVAGGGNWNVKSRPRVDTDRQQLKLRWEMKL